MKKVEVKVVIGSNYGDECKGLATRYFSEQTKPNQKCLNVLFNGGCQRGHTVELKNGVKHVFHHFGCGTYSNAYTYFDQNFMLNPIVFIEEYDSLAKDGIIPICISSGNCRITTPYDSFINQIVEKSRDKNRHGSCGYGIWETQKRYEDGRYALRLNDLIRLSDNDILRHLYEIAKVYLPEQLRKYNISDIPDEYQYLIESTGLMYHFLADIRRMQSLITIKEFDEIVGDFDLIVFEGAQGLELDENNTNGYPNVTASDTTSFIPLQRVKQFNCDVEVCYITRSYFTRHGAGSFPTECEKSVINNNIEDKTNVVNDYQQEIRYGLFDKDEFLNRVNKDIHMARNNKEDVRVSLFISHLNYTGNEIFGNCTIAELSKHFDKVYLSSSKYAEDVKNHSEKR